MSDGYARNCLFKKKLAVEATAAGVNAINGQKKAAEFHKAEEIRKWRETAASIKGKEVTCFVKCGENGKVFGSVTSKEIADKLRELGYEIDKKKIVLGDTLKTVGVYDAEIKFLPDVSAKIKVKVEAAE